MSYYDDRWPTKHVLKNAPSVSVVVYYVGEGEWSVNGHRFLFSGSKGELLESLQNEVPRWLKPVDDARR